MSRMEFQQKGNFVGRVGEIIMMDADQHTTTMGIGYWISIPPPWLLVIRSAYHCYGYWLLDQYTARMVRRHTMVIGYRISIPPPWLLVIGSAYHRHGYWLLDLHTTTIVIGY